MVRKRFGSDDFNGEGAVPEGGSIAPPKPGSYIGILRRLSVSSIQNGPNAGADRLRVGVEITGPKGAKRTDDTSAIGAWVFSGLNVTEQGAGYVNQFMWAITGATTEAEKQKAEKAFWGKGKFDGADVDDSDNVIKFGKDIFVNSPDGEIVLGITTKNSPDTRPDHKGEMQADISRYLVPKDDSDDDDDEDDDEEEDDTDEDDEDDDDSEDDESDDDDESEEDDEEEESEDERREELEAMSLVAVRKAAKAAGVEASDIKGASKEDLVDLILEAEEESDDEEEEADTLDPTEARQAELEALSLIKLKAEAKKVGLTASDIKGLEKEDLIEAIIENEEPPF
jgi:hypothetical protein